MSEEKDTKNTLGDHPLYRDYHERVTPLPAAPAPTDDYRQIAHLIGTIYMAGDFKAETGAERKLESLLIKTGHRYANWAEVDAINERAFALASQPVAALPAEQAPTLQVHHIGQPQPMPLDAALSIIESGLQGARAQFAEQAVELPPLPQPMRVEFERPHGLAELFYFTADNMLAFRAEGIAADRAVRQAPTSPPIVTREHLKEVEAIVHGDGNIFLTDFAKLNRAVALAARQVVAPDGAVERDAARTIATGYESGTMISDASGLGATIRLHYESPAEAENAFAALSNLIDQEKAS